MLILYDSDMWLHEYVFDLVAPYACLGCGQESKLICNWCAPDAFPVVPPRCFRCFDLNKDCRVCQACRKIIPLNHVWMLTTYKGLPKKLIYSMKLHASRQAATIIAQELDARLPFFSANHIVTYIPTAPKRVRERGFDHAYLIAKEFASLRGLPMQTLLGRKNTAKQATASRAERLELVKNTYFVTAPLPQSPLLVIDDIVTTGATLTEAARTLRRAGAKTIDGLIFAQTV